MQLFKNYNDTALKTRVNDVENEIIKLKTQLSSLLLENEDLRNKVLRKIQTKKEIIQEELVHNDGLPRFGVK